MIRRRRSTNPGLALRLALLLVPLLGPAMVTEAAAVETPALGASAVGNYLAGRHAQYERANGKAADYYLAALARDPKNADLVQRAFLILAADGQIDRALELARRLIGLPNADTNLADLTLGIGELKERNIAGARKWIDKLPETGLAAFIRPLVEAWLLTAEKKYDEALKVLDAKSKNQGLAVLYGAHKALIEDIAGRSLAAITEYEKVAKERKTPNLRLTQLMGGLYERLGQTADARKVYDAYMAQNPGSTVFDGAYKRLAAGTAPERDVQTAQDGVAEALFSLAGSLRQQDPFETLMFARLALYLRPSLDIATLLIAETLESDERFADANKVYRTLGRTSPFSWTARLRIASNLDELDKPDAAVRELREMASERTDRAETLITIGDIMRRRERYREAADAYDEARKRIPKLDRGHWRLMYVTGIAHERLKQWAKAEPAFLTALKLKPDEPFVLNYLGYSWVEQGKNMDKARAMIEKAVEQRPTDGYIVDSLGWVLYRMGDLKGSVKELERAVELRPDDPTINDHLGDVYWRVGRRDEARFQWEKSLHLDPDKDLEAAINKKLKNGLPPAKASASK